MADFITIDDAALVDRNVSVDELAGSLFVQRVKLQFGADGSAADISTTNPLPVQLIKPSNHHFVTLASVNAANIKASAAVLRSIHGFNYAGYPIKVCLHNSTGPPTAGVGVLFAQVVQAGTRLDVEVPEGGLDFSAGLGRTVVKVAVAGDISDTGATAVAANDGVFDIGFE